MGLVLNKTVGGEKLFRHVFITVKIDEIFEFRLGRVLIIFKCRGENKTPPTK